MEGIVKVFIADDSEVVRQRLIDIFAEISGIEIVGQARDAAEAIGSIQKLRPDAVVLDVRMIGGSGIDVLKRVKKSEPCTVVIMLTNYPYAQYRKRCMAEGADYFFDKSAEFEKVAEVVKQLAEDSRNRTGRYARRKGPTNSKDSRKRQQC